jgi:hypothetical protein
MKTETIVQAGFAVGIVVAAASIAGALLGRGSRRVLVALAAALGVGALAAWVGFAYDLGRDTAVAAAGLTVCFAAALASTPLRAAVTRERRVEAELAAAEARLHALVERETAHRASELERTIARARADATSRLAEEERQLADKRRNEVTERERRVASELRDALALVERRVQQRLADWASDLDRMQQALTARLAELAQRQRELLAEAQARIEADADQLKSVSEEQRTTLKRLREEFDRAAREVGSSARRDVEVHEAERRRALHEVAERLRQRERELRNRIATEETEAARRVQAGFADVERRQIDQLGRIVERAANRLAETAVEQFGVAVKAARDDAARRLSRELDRAVAQFAHDAQSVLAERLAQVSDAGAARIDRKLTKIVGTIEERRDEFLTDFRRRISDTETELRAQIGAIGADAEAERAVLEARVLELTRRLETVVARAETGLEGAFRAE